MVCFTVYNIPDVCCLADHFRLNASSGQCLNITDPLMVKFNPSKSCQTMIIPFLIWPLILLLILVRNFRLSNTWLLLAKICDHERFKTKKRNNRFICCTNRVTPSSSASTNNPVDSNEKNKQLEDTESNNPSFKKKMFPTFVHYFIDSLLIVSRSNLLSYLPRLESIVQFGFIMFVFVWAIIYSVTDRYQLYLQITAAVFILGWLYTFYAATGFSLELRLFEILINNIIIYDIGRFVFIYVFVLAGFSCAIFSLDQADYSGINHSDRNFTDTVYLTFSIMLTLGDLFENTMDINYESDGGNLNVYRTVVAMYLCIVTILLLNLFDRSHE